LNLAGLSFDNIPPFSLPLRFFISAACFGLLCALIIGIGGEELWHSRWHPYTLALTHALVLGVFTMVMCGATLQLVSVLGGQSLPRVNLIANTTLIGLVIGTLSLIAGFIYAQSWLLVLAFTLILLGISLLLGAILLSIGRTNQQQHSLKVMRLAMLSMLCLLIVAGLLLSDRLIGSAFNQLKQLTDAHAGLGLIGWVCLLIMGVSFQVLPMFHVAPAFPHWSQRFLPLSLLVLLLGKVCFSALTISPYLMAIIDSAITMLVLIYSGVALHVIYRRKRKIPDPSITLWYVALITLALCLCASLFDFYLRLSPLIYASLYCIAILSIIVAMLVKIAPFLAYIHLQRQCGINFEAFSLLPNVHQLMSKSGIKLLFYSHIITIVSLLATLLMPLMYMALSLSLMVEFFVLLVLLFGVTRHYRKISAAIARV